MHPDQPARVPAVGTRLRPEARRPGRIGQRQIPGGQRFACVQIRERNLGGGDEEQLPVRDPGLEEVFLELGQLAGAGHGRPAHQRWQRELGVTVPSGVQVQEELGDGPLQLGADALEDGEPRAGQFRRPGEIEDAQALADGRVISRLEVEHRQIAPPAYLDGEVLRVAVRAAVLRQVRDLQQQRLQLVIQLLLPPLTGRDLRLQGPAAFYQLAGVLAALGRCLHLLRDPLGFRPRAFDLTDRGVAAC